MSLNPWAGKPAEPSMLVNIPRLMTTYYTHRPDPSVPEHHVAFGTSGHRGSAFEHSFNEAHILAMSQAICLYPQQEHIDGPFSWASTRMPCRSRPLPAPSKCWRRTAWM